MNSPGLGRKMFSSREDHAKDDLEEVMRLQSVADSLSEMKQDLISNVEQRLQDIPTGIDAASNRDLQIDEIHTLTDTLQNKSVELLSNSSNLESGRSLELSNFSHHSQLNEPGNEIQLGTISNTGNTLTLDHTQYYEGLNNAPIMVYQMTHGNIVPFESLVSVPISKSGEDKTNESVDLLHNAYSTSEVFNNSSHSVTQPLYILPDKFKSNENDKMLIGQIYSSDDPTNLFLDTRQPLMRQDKCEISITDSMNTQLNLATPNNFDSSLPISSVSDINQFPITATYASTDTDSEVALTLASLGNLKNYKIKESSPEEPRVLDIPLSTEADPETLDPKMNSRYMERETCLTSQRKKESGSSLVLRSRRGRAFAAGSQHSQSSTQKKDIDTNTERGIKSLENCKEKSVGKGASKTKNGPRSRSKPPLERKANCGPRKENLLGQLLKASKHCEPASLIPEGVVDDVIPAVGYRIMDMSNLNEMIRMMHRCSNTSSKGLIVIQEQASLREGAVSQLSIICTGCQEGAVCATSNKSHGHLFDMNARVEQLRKEFNIEEFQVQRMLEILGIFYRPHDQNIERNESKASSPQEEVAPEVEQTPPKRRRRKPLKTKEKNVECKICHKKFTGAHYLKSHMFIHDNLLHTCPYCQAYFKRVFNLQEHIKKHENIKYECDICHKSYTDRSTLCAHKKSFHQEEYKRECKVCSKKFFHKVHYLEHLRVHSGEKPFACTVCGKRYPYVNSVKRHMQSHNVLAKYKCRLCGKCFRWLFGIRQHLFQQHKLKKCDIDSQVITEVIAETFPANATPKKLASVSKAAPNPFVIQVAKHDLSKASHSLTKENDELQSEAKPGPAPNPSFTIAVAPDSQFYSDRTEVTNYSNINDWKKPL